MPISCKYWVVGKAADRKSISGGVVMCDVACVPCFAQMAKCSTLPLTEAGYVGMATGVRTTTFMCYLVCLKFYFLYCDVGCTTVKEDLVTTPNSKHVYVR